MFSEVEETLLDFVLGMREGWVTGVDICEDLVYDWRRDGLELVGGEGRHDWFCWFWFWVWFAVGLGI